ncbi:MAG: glycosyltransferase family 4 protein [Phenylobacterium sp.]|uniref:glycosyltransferase family 4 protein n=1 Tax=Phenylobacterium sp. TaxID=1871053 RepID=UPI00391C4B16
MSAPKRPRPAPVGQARRVLITTDAVGGVWTYSLDLARGLAARGAEVKLMQFGPHPSAAQRAAARRIPGLELLETDLPLDWTAADEPALAAAAAGLAQAAERLDVDLIHLNGPPLAARPLGRPVVGVCHSCLATWWAAVRTGDFPEEFQWRARAYWRGLLNCDALAAPSAAFAEAIARAYDVPAPRVIHNGRARFSAEPSADAPAVFTAGRLWDPGKDAATFDAAAAALERLDFAAAGPLAGPSGEGVELTACRWAGNLAQDEVLARLANRPVFVSTALYEPFGLAVLEAAQAGCPLVLADIPTFRELWGDCAVFFAPRDARDLSAKVAAVAADPALARRLGEAARARAASFTLEAMVEGVLGLYGELGCGLTGELRLEAAE